MGYWLLVAGYWLMVAGYWFLVAGYWSAPSPAFDDGWIKTYLPTQAPRGEGLFNFN
ncbi:MAG: hypothetical protein IPH20_09155 [Bacteroidales bacterium]|nr:hypothetical protein [Bacteroidales bacterium]